MELKHLTEDILTRHVARNLSPGELVTFYEHIGTCALCAERVARAAESRVKVNDWRILLAEPVAVVPHTTEVELVEHVAGLAPAPRRRQVESHLAQCETCGAAARSLRDFRDGLAAPARKVSTMWWLAVAAALCLMSGLTWQVLQRQNAGPLMVASLRDGGAEIGLTADGQLKGFAGFGPQEKALLVEAMRDGRIPLGPRPFASSSGVLRSGEAVPAGFAVLTPVDRQILSNRPQFRWTELRGAASYQVFVMTEDLVEVANSDSLQATSWRPEKDLPRGKTLLWQVAAVRGGNREFAPAPPLKEARFSIVTEDFVTRLDALRPSHLRAAILLAANGLDEEAVEELNSLAAENPGSPVVERLRQSLNDGRSFKR